MEFSESIPEFVLSGRIRKRCKHELFKAGVLLGSSPTAEADKNPAGSPSILRYPNSNLSVRRSAGNKLFAQTRNCIERFGNSHCKGDLEF